MVNNTNTIKPNTYLTDSKVSAKDNKNKKGEVTSQSYSTVIPKPILTKLGLQKGQILYWDILDDNKIIITPEINPVRVPEEASINAGMDILNDMLFNSNSTAYNSVVNNIKSELYDKELSVESKANNLLGKYNDTPYKDEFTQVVLYLLDYPLGVPDQYEILREVYKEITQTD